jgi:tetratricopeptide (TPR) repeat protein
MEGREKFLDHGIGSILAAPADSHGVVQTARPLADSLEWQLGQVYLQRRGNGAFIGDVRPVPYVVNNDGAVSRRAAALLFANLRAADASGAAAESVICLELGIGVGLFARYFLDAFSDLCRAEGEDYYSQCSYIAADHSERMLRDACRQGVFAGHPGRYVLRVVDAMDPGQALAGELAGRGHDSGTLRAVFLNYLLDCLPATVLEVEGNEVRQLCVRTCLARGVRLEDHTDLTLDQLRERAQSTDSRVLDELLPVYHLFSSQYDFQPCDVSTIPYGDFAVDFARRNGGRVLHNYGAIQALERLLDFVDKDGFILINDYGSTQVNPSEEYEHQQFSLATFIGVNFPLLKAYFADRRRLCWAEPAEEGDSLHARLLAHRLPEETVQVFRQQFAKSASDRLNEPVNKARAWVKAGRLDSAVRAYQQALESQPANWLLANEVAQFLTFTLGEPRQGADIAKAGLALNPLSAELWNTLGDALFEWGRAAQAREAYLRAIQLNENDPRSRYNLAWVNTAQKNYAAALQNIAEAFILDRTGEYQERLLHKQREILDGVLRRNQQEMLRRANRISTGPVSRNGHTHEPTAGAKTPD